MPTYQYACTACEHRFDAVQAFSDDALTECPECGGRLRKLYGAVGVVFKGSGFYRTDSRADPKKGAATKTESTTGSGGGSTTGDSTQAPKAKPSTDSKPAGSSASSTSGAGSAA